MMHFESIIPYVYFSNSKFKNFNLRTLKTSTKCDCFDIKLRIVLVCSNICI